MLKNKIIVKLLKHNIHKLNLLKKNRIKSNKNQKLKYSKIFIKITKNNKQINKKYHKKMLTSNKIHP